jgi:anti-sigma regulatory factor (Ser/Thr protein kinase)
MGSRCLPESAVLEIVLKNRPEEKRRLLVALESFVGTHHLPKPVFQAADLVLEEHLTNVMSYAYDDRQEHEIRVRLEASATQLVIEVEDDGRAFDPTQAPEVDTSLPLDQRPIGGLGIHFIRRCMDEARYQRRANRNVLRMIKRLPVPAP